MRQQHSAVVRELVEECHRVAAHGLIPYSSGNMSCRINDRLMAIKGTGRWFEQLRPSDVAICRIADAVGISGPPASIESRFHAGIYRVRPDVNVVLHFQSLHATAIACGCPKKWNFMIIPEIPYYVGEPAVINAYLAPGSSELAKEVIQAARNHDMIILRNHGQVTVGRDFDEVIQRGGYFEMACEMLVHSPDIKPLPAKDSRALHEKARLKRSV